MNEFEVYLIGGGDEEKATVTTESQGGKCQLTFSFRSKQLSAQASDYFSALCTIRQQLESDQLIPFCYGASLNVYPSGMCRDMGEGMVAYKTELGHRANRENLVNIFDQGHDVIPSSVDQQKEHFEQWLLSIK